MQPANDTGSNRQRRVSTRPLALRIVGKDLLLSGRFSNWMPLAVASADGTGEESDAVKLVVDTTSLTGRAERGRNMFSFEATDVRRLAPLNYAARGTFNVGRLTRTVDVVLNAPAAHSPFLSLSFVLPRAAYRDFWRALEARIPNARAREGDDVTTELRARAWLRSPDVAAA